jgi:hypothetical protein
LFFWYLKSRKKETFLLRKVAGSNTQEAPALNELGSTWMERSLSLSALDALPETRAFGQKRQLFAKPLLT